MNSDKKITMNQLLAKQIINLKTQAAEYRRIMRVIEEESNERGGIVDGSTTQRSIVRLDAKAEALENWARDMEKSVMEMSEEQRRQTVWVDVNF